MAGDGKIQPGLFDQLIGLLKPSTTKDRFGQHTVYNLIANVAAQVEQLRGREFFAAAATQSPATVEMTSWWRSDIDSTWRVSWMGKQYEIVAEPIDVKSKHEFMQFYCTTAKA